MGSRQMYVLDLSRAEVLRVDADEDLARLDVDTNFLLTRALPPDGCISAHILSPMKRNAYRSLTFTTAKAFSTNSRTGCVSPVARTKSSGPCCCSMRHMPST